MKTFAIILAPQSEDWILNKNHTLDIFRPKIKTLSQQELFCFFNLKVQSVPRMPVDSYGVKWVKTHNLQCHSVAFKSIQQHLHSEIIV